MVKAKKDSQIIHKIRSEGGGKSGGKLHHLECFDMQVTETQLKVVA